VGCAERKAFACSTSWLSLSCARIEPGLLVDQRLLACCRMFGIVDTREYLPFPVALTLLLGLRLSLRPVNI